MDYEERLASALIDADKEFIRSVVGDSCNSCPWGMSQEDVYRLKDFLSVWSDTKKSAWGIVIKVVSLLMLVVVALGIAVKTLGVN